MKRPAHRHKLRTKDSVRQRTSAYVSICQHTSAYVSIRQHTWAHHDAATLGTRLRALYPHKGHVVCSVAWVTPHLRHIPLSLPLSLHLSLSALAALVIPLSSLYTHLRHIPLSLPLSLHLSLSALAPLFIPAGRSLYTH
jgi:hypothetical protein